MCGRWRREDARLTLESVVTTHEPARGELGEDRRRGRRDLSRSRGRKSVKKHLEFFTETEREKERERRRARRGKDVCLDTALPQEHCYRQGRYKDGE